MHGGEVPLVHGLDVGELVEVVGAERAQPGWEVAEGAGRAAGRSGYCFRGGSMVKIPHVTGALQYSK